MERYPDEVALKRNATATKADGLVSRLILEAPTVWALKIRKLVDTVGSCCSVGMTRGKLVYEEETENYAAIKGRQVPRLKSEKSNIAVLARRNGVTDG